MLLSVGPAYDLSIRAHMIEQNTPPEILVHGLVTPNDVDNLFKMYVACPLGRFNLPVADDRGTPLLTVITRG